MRDLYKRHAEVACSIHEDTLREFTGNQNLKVDLIHENPLGAKKAVLEKLGEYDVVSVSSGLADGSLIGGSNLYNKDVIDYARQHVQFNEIPVYVVAAGNDGETAKASQPRLADFSRTSLVVGEANVSKDGTYIEDHSTINPYPLDLFRLIAHILSHDDE